MTDKPIPFSAAMIRALLDGRKTQTRRVLCAADPSDDAEEGYRDFPPPYVAFGAPVYENPEDGNVYRFRRTYAIGDRLWVREAWRTADAYDDLKPSDLGGEEPIFFEADGSAETFGWAPPRAWGRYRHGRYMPRWASRLTLTVTDVRVQRVQEISEADARAEGVESDSDGWRDYQMPNTQCCGTALESFRTLWDSLNGPRGYGWDANPWVAAYTFTVARQNIDQVQV